MSKKLLIILASVLVVVTGAITAVITVSNAPSNVLARAVTDFTEDILERDEIVPIIKTLKNGSVELAFTGIKKEDEDSYDTSRQIKGKVNFSKDAILLSDVNIKQDKNSIVGELYLSKDYFYINEEKILKGTYGIEYSDAENQLNNSIFAPQSKSDYALEQSAFDALVSVINYYEIYDDISKDMKKIAKKLGKKLWGIIVDNADISKKNTDMRINGDKNKVRLIELTIDADALENIFLDAVDYLRDSKEVEKFLDKYDDILSPILATLTEGEVDSIKEMYYDFFSNNEEAIDDFCDEISNNFETLTLKIATPKSSAKLLKLEVVYDKTSMITLECGTKGIKKTDKITLTAGDLEISYQVKSNDKKKFDAVCNICLEGDEEYEISATIDKANEKYKVTQKTMYESYDYNYGEDYTSTYEYIISGKFSQKGNKTTLSVDNVKYVYNKQYKNNSLYNKESEEKIKLKCEIVIATKDKMPSHKKNYYGLSDITEKDIKAWAEKFEDFDIDII